MNNKWIAIFLFNSNLFFGLFEVKPMETQDDQTTSKWVEEESQELKEGTKTQEQKQESKEDVKDKKPLELQRIIGNPLGIGIHGYLQNSYTSVPFHGADKENRNFFLYPNRLANSWQGNQYYLIVEKALKTEKKFDIGFRVDMLYGNDWEFTKAYGLFDGLFKSGSFYGYDVPQLYMDIQMPIFGKKSSLILGRFYNPGDYEGKMAIKRPLFSSSYMINSTPFTFLGSLLSVEWKPSVNLLFGVVNGSDRYYNPKFKPGVIGGVSYSISQNLYLKSIHFVGPNQLPYFPGVEEAGLPIAVRTSPEVQWLPNYGYSQNLRFYSSNVITYKWNKHWKVSKEISLNKDENTPLIRYNLLPRTTRWNSIGSWIYYDLYGNGDYTLIKRIEFFSDYQGAVTQNPGRYVGLTFGLAWKPSQRVWFRPEVRYDRSLNSLAFQSNESGHRWTVSFDFFVFF